LVKYIPGETIAFYVPIYPMIPKDSTVGLAVVLVCGIVGSVGYLYLSADKNSPPKPFFYVLAAIAFLAWALGTSSVGQDLVGLPEYANRVALPAAVFVVPLVDQILTRTSTP
jgi:hypothetical protein